MKNMKTSVAEGIADPYLALISPLPDCVHVGKSLKASYANWYLKLDNERGNLAILRTLRNKASPDVKKEMQRLLPLLLY